MDGCICGSVENTSGSRLALGRVVYYYWRLHGLDQSVTQTMVFLVTSEHPIRWHHDISPTIVLAAYRRPKSYD